MAVKLRSGIYLLCYQNDDSTVQEGIPVVWTSDHQRNRSCSPLKISQLLIMHRPFYALFRDPYDPELHIRIYADQDQAEAALKRMASRDAEIIRFMVNEQMLDFSMVQPIYIAFSFEDDGPRIHAAFDSSMGLRTYLLDHYCESPCHSAIGWTGMARNGVPAQTGELRMNRA